MEERVTFFHDFKWSLISEYFSWSIVESNFYFKYFIFCNLCKVGSFRKVFSNESIWELDSSLLPWVIWMTEVYWYSDKLFEFFMSFKCYIIVECKGVQILYGLEHPLYDSMNIIYASGFYLSHKNKTSLSFMKYKEWALVLFSGLWIFWRDNEVSLPITKEESFICCYRPIIDEDSLVPIWENFCWFKSILFLFSSLLHLMKIQIIGYELPLSWVKIFVDGSFWTFAFQSGEWELFSYSSCYFFRRPIESQMFFDEFSEFHIFQYLSFLVFAILFSYVCFLLGNLLGIFKSESIPIVSYFTWYSRYISMHHLCNSTKRVFSCREKELKFIPFSKRELRVFLSHRLW